MSSKRSLSDNSETYAQADEETAKPQSPTKRHRADQEAGTTELEQTSAEPEKAAEEPKTQVSAETPKVQIFGSSFVTNTFSSLAKQGSTFGAANGSTAPALSGFGTNSFASLSKSASSDDSNNNSSHSTTPFGSNFASSSTFASLAKPVQSPTLPAATFGSSFTSNSFTFSSLASTKTADDLPSFSQQPIPTDVGSSQEPAASTPNGSDTEPAPTAFGESTRPNVSEVVVITGEENERTLFHLKARLYELDIDKSDWKERGVGTLKLNVDQSKESARLVMRSDGSLRLILNARLFDGVSCECVSDKGVRFISLDPENKRSVTYLIRARSKDEAQGLVEAVSRQCKLSSPLGVQARSSKKSTEHESSSSKQPSEQTKEEDNKPTTTTTDDSDDSANEGDDSEQK